MSAIRRTLELQVGQENLLLPEGLFMIDRRERPLRGGWYDIEYDPFDQFVAVVGPSVENASRFVIVAKNAEDHAHGN